MVRTVKLYWDNDDTHLTYYSTIVARHGTRKVLEEILGKDLKRNILPARTIIETEEGLEFDIYLKRRGHWTKSYRTTIGNLVTALLQSGYEVSQEGRKAIE